MDKNTYFMHLALQQAYIAYKTDEVPIGAVLVDHKDNIISKSCNYILLPNNPIGHAEINVIIQAAESRKNYRLLTCKLYSTLEPCLMCFGAIMHARICELHYSAFSPAHGAFSRHKLDPRDFNIKIYTGSLRNASKIMLKDFFSNKRRANQTLLEISKCRSDICSVSTELGELVSKQ